MDPEDELQVPDQGVPVESAPAEEPGFLSQIGDGVLPLISSAVTGSPDGLVPTGGGGIDGPSGLPVLEERGFVPEEGVGVDGQLAADQSLEQNRIQALDQEFQPEQIQLGIQGTPFLAPLPTNQPSRGGRAAPPATVQIQREFAPPPTTEEATALQNIAAAQQADDLNQAAAELQQAGATADEMEDYAELSREDPVAAHGVLQRMRTQRDRVLADVEDTIRTVSTTRVDPERFFHSRGAATSFGAALSVAAGAAASTLVGGPNFAAQIIDRAIERDIRAQEFDLQNQRAAAQTGLGLLDRIRTVFQDDASAVETLREMRLTNAQARLRAMSARATSDVQRAALDNLVNTLEDRKQAAGLQRRQSTTRILMRGNIHNAREARQARRAAALAQAEAGAITAQTQLAEEVGAQARGADSSIQRRRSVGSVPRRGQTPPTPVTQQESGNVSLGPNEVAARDGQGNPIAVPSFSAAAQDGVTHQGNVLFVQGGALGNQSFHLLPDSPLRIQPGQGDSNTRSREQDRGTFAEIYESAAQTNQAMRSAATLLRREGFPDTLDQFAESDRTKLRSIYDQAVRRWVEMRSVAINSGVVSEGENQRFASEAGSPSTFEQILSRVIPGQSVVDTFATRMEIGATDASDFISRAGQRFRVIIPRSQLSRLRVARSTRGQ